MNRELQTIIVEVEKAVVGKREVIEKDPDGAVG